MTKRLLIGFTFLTCGMTALATVSCSSGDDESSPASGGAMGSLGGAMGSLGGADGLGGNTDVGAGGSTVQNGTGFDVQAAGYVVSAPWQGYAWVGKEAEALSVGATTTTPATFETATAGQTLCLQGEVGGDEAYGGVAMLGINLNQAADSTTPGTWAVTGSGVAYDVTNQGTSPLRIQIQGAAGYPTEAWCANVTGQTGTIPWGDFNTKCWGDATTVAYDTTAPIPLQSIMVLVPGLAAAAQPYSFCIGSLAVAP